MGNRSVNKPLERYKDPISHLKQVNVKYNLKWINR